MSLDRSFAELVRYLEGWHEEMERELDRLYAGWYGNATGNAHKRVEKPVEGSSVDSEG